MPGAGREPRHVVVVERGVHGRSGQVLSAGLPPLRRLSVASCPRARPVPPDTLRSMTGGPYRAWMASEPGVSSANGGASLIKRSAFLHAVSRSCFARS